MTVTDSNYNGWRGDDTLQWLVSVPSYNGWRHVSYGTGATLSYTLLLGAHAATNSSMVDNTKAILVLVAIL